MVSQSQLRTVRSLIMQSIMCILLYLSFVPSVFSYTTCSTPYQCSNTYLEDSYIDCTGAFSCVSSSLIGTGSPQLYCDGANSCSYSPDILFSFQTYCFAASSCAYANINSPKSVFCHGHLACAHSVIPRDCDSIYGIGSYALYNATIIDPLSLTLKGFHTGYGAKVICNAGFSCTIRCHGNGCYMTHIEGNGTPNIVINPGAIAPITDQPHSLNDTANLPFAFMNITVQNEEECNNPGTEDICCRNAYSCNGSPIVQKKGNLVCSGSGTCQTNITHTNGSVFCSGSRTCKGDMGSTPVINATNLYCLGSASCSKAQIYNRGTVTCLGRESCSQSTISSPGLGGRYHFYVLSHDPETKRQTVDTIWCQTNDRCFIKCGAYSSCAFVNIICNGTCTICNGTDLCYSVPALTASPSSHPSLLPTAHPSVSTAHPSLLPTAQPSLLPTTHPSTTSISYLSTTEATTSPLPETSAPVVNATTMNLSEEPTTKEPIAYIDTTAVINTTFVTMDEDYDEDGTQLTVSITINSEVINMTALTVNEMLVAHLDPDVKILSVEMIKDNKVSVIISTQLDKEVIENQVADAFEAKYDDVDIVIEENGDQTEDGDTKEDNDIMSVLMAGDYSLFDLILIALITAIMFVCCFGCACFCFVRKKKKAVTNAESMMGKMESVSAPGQQSTDHIAANLPDLPVITSNASGDGELASGELHEENDDKRCVDCGAVKSGKYAVDGFFYCNDCYDCYEDDENDNDEGTEDESHESLYDAEGGNTGGANTAGA